jgi:hypothetical protein
LERRSAARKLETHQRSNLPDRLSLGPTPTIGEPVVDLIPFLCPRRRRPCLDPPWPLCCGWPPLFRCGWCPSLAAAVLLSVVAACLLTSHFRPATSDRPHPKREGCTKARPQDRLDLRPAYQSLAACDPSSDHGSSPPSSAPRLHHSWIPASGAWKLPSGICHVSSANFSFIHWSLSGRHATITACE